ncbi:unnamed protein product [Anisakis simplex]|uniref:Uncharacterized protein n=1 Tax=Anisakis simplex TaxID=6269 RepID=A0A3P6NDF7_ANISI|nr:unnamed protein product [Anisakis simplex]
MDEEALLHQRPSQPSTLFDFIQQSAVPATSDSAPTNLKSEAIAPTKPYPQQFGKPNTSSPPPLSASRGGVRGDGGGPGYAKNFGRGFSNRGNSRGFTANRGNRGGAQMSNSNRSRGGYQGSRGRRDVTSANAFSGSPQNDRFVLNNDGSFPPLNPQNQKQSSVNTITNGMSGMDLNTKSSTSNSAAMDRSTSSNRYTNKPYDTYSNNKPSYNDNIGASNRRGNDRFNNDAIPSSNQPLTYTKTNSNYQSAGTRYEQGQQSQPQQRILQFNRSYNNSHYNYGPPSSSPMPYNGGQKSNSPKFSTRTGLPIWKVGDKCLAPWSDGQV